MTHALYWPDIVTICMGQAASMAAILQPPEQRRVLASHSRIVIHQPSVEGIAGQATDVKIYAEELLRTRNLLSHILADLTGQPFEKTDRDVERDFILSPTQALDYGLIDNVLSSRDLGIGALVETANLA
jgi:ATP-dependent Clp protease protease subunit